MARFIVASRTVWSIQEFMDRRARLPNDWLLVTAPEDLKSATAQVPAPRYVFFPHWSHIVPQSILDATECVCFHMTDVPYGRGGSPLQNLISRGHKETKLTALRMVKDLDAGPVYRKVPLSLEGSAETIFARAGAAIMDLVEWIATTEPTPVEQTGEPTFFKRRTPEQSAIDWSAASAEGLYDHIRMLDAPGYPHAFGEQGNWRMEFTGARLDGEAVEARVRIARKEGSR